LDVGDLLRGLGVDVGPGANSRPLRYSDASDRLREAYGPAAAMTADQLRRIAEGYDRSTRLAARFAPRVFRGDALLLIAEDGPHDGWGDSITGTVQEEHVDCGHNDMMQPKPARAIGMLVENYLSRRGR
jgi:thioesterase domain-containing protein